MLLKTLDKQTKQPKQVVIDLRGKTSAERQAIYRTLMRIVKKLPSSYSLYVRKNQNKCT